eukprot:1677454-Rhodomonas_salina.2
MRGSEDAARESMHGSKRGYSLKNSRDLGTRQGGTAWYLCAVGMAGSHSKPTVRSTPRRDRHDL